MTTDIRNFDASFLSPLVLTIIKNINEPENCKNSLDDYVSLVRKYNVFTLCDSILALSPTENELEQCVNSINDSTTDYMSLLNSLRELQARMLSEDGYWIEVFYPITSVIIYYLYRNRATVNPECDTNLDNLSSRQVLKTIGTQLEELLKGEQLRFCKALRPKIKTGCISVVEECVFAYKYYYVDLNGKRHSQFNSAEKRDVAVGKYLESCYIDSRNLPNALYSYCNRIVRSLSDEYVYKLFKKL